MMHTMKQAKITPNGSVNPLGSRLAAERRVGTHANTKVYMEPSNKHCTPANSKMRESLKQASNAARMLEVDDDGTGVDVAGALFKEGTDGVCSLHSDTVRSKAATRQPAENRNTATGPAEVACKASATTPAITATIPSPNHCNKQQLHHHKPKKKEG
jgi:hypothetical protein